MTLHVCHLTALSLAPPAPRLSLFRSPQHVRVSTVCLTVVEQLRRAAAANTTAVGDALEEDFVEAMLKLAELGFTHTNWNAVLLCTMKG